MIRIYLNIILNLLIIKIFSHLFHLALKVIEQLIEYHKIKEIIH